MVDARIGNLNIRAIIDTGAQASVGNAALRQALATRYVRKHDLSTRYRCDGDVQPGMGANISTLSIGS